MIADFDSKTPLKHRRIEASIQSANPNVIDDSLGLIAFTFLSIVFRVGNSVP